MRYLIGIDKAGRAARKGEPHPVRYLIGMDEAGRGPLAGPISVAGVKIPYSFSRSSLWQGIRDSKKLTPKNREKWFRILTTHPEVQWAVAKVWPSVIDRINIVRAGNLAVLRVYQHLAPGKVTLDAGLALPSHIPHEAIIKGDERIPWIAAASIIAKVSRDRSMLRLHKKYPIYNFNLHKGYATKLHFKLLRQHGHSRAHRVSFLRKLHG